MILAIHSGKCMPFKDNCVMPGGTLYVCLLVFVFSCTGSQASLLQLLPIDDSFYHSLQPALRFLHVKYMMMLAAAGAASVDVYMDSHSHPQQSLLQAGLTELQGPALSFHIPGMLAMRWAFHARVAFQESDHHKVHCCLLTL